MSEDDWFKSNFGALRASEIMRAPLDEDDADPPEFDEPGPPPDIDFEAMPYWDDRMVMCPGPVYSRMQEAFAKRSREPLPPGASVADRAKKGTVDAVLDLVAEAVITDDATRAVLAAKEAQRIAARGDSDVATQFANKAMRAVRGRPGAEAAFQELEPRKGPAPESARFKTLTSFVAEYVPIDHVVEGVIRTGSLYTLTAKTGVGKTALLICAGLAVATGREDVIGRPVTKGRVAYVCAENPDGFRMRLMVAAHALNVDIPKIGDDFIILDVRKKPEEILAELKKLAEGGPSFALIVVDTLQAVFDGDDSNNNVTVGEFMRRLRPMAQLPGHPAIVVAAHPVKNASDDNLVPYGAGAVLNEVDGNLTLRLTAGGVVELHWQGKLRGNEFDPIRFRFENLTSPDVKDVKGREVQVPVMRPIAEDDAEIREARAISRDVLLMQEMSKSPRASIRDLALAVGVDRSAIERTLKRLASPDGGKLVAKALDRWALTPAGLKALDEHANPRSGNPDRKLDSDFQDKF